MPSHLDVDVVLPRKVRAVATQDAHNLGLIVRLDVPEDLRPFIGHGLASIRELRQVARDAVIARLVLMQATAATKAKYARWIAAGRPDMGGNILSDGVQR